MKKIFSILILQIFIISTIGAIATPENINFDTVHINESITISKPKIIDESDFSTILLDEGNSYLLDSGSPMIPTVNKVYELPFGSKINNIDVSYNGNHEILLTKFIKPAKQPTPVGMDLKIQPDMEIYSNSDIFPKDKFTYRTGSGMSDDEHVLFLTIQCYPVWYNPGENILHYSDSIDIDISYSKGGYENTASADYDLVVISPKIFSSNLQKFIDHKNSLGINSFFKDVDEIYDEFSGRDKPEQIKNYIKYAIENLNLSYVLLVGGINYVPIRMTAIGWDHSTMHLPTDLYYADIYDGNGDFCTWDSNNNNIFGEYNWDDGNIDDVDLYADVYLGRIPCDKNIDLKIIINKIITYENNAYNSDWFNRILLLGGDTFPHHGVIEGELVTSRIAEEMDGFNSIFLWTSEETFKPLRINREATKGAGFVSYSGHGYLYGFGTSPPNVEKRIEYFTWYLPGMLNGNKLPIVFFDACLTATLDYKLFDLFKIPGFAYSIVKKPFGGAVASIGATRVAFTDVDWHGVNGGASYLNLHFFMNYEEGISVSEMLTKSQNDYINYVYEDCITLEEFILIGDPSLKTGGYP
ncbi:MAG: hypothetical protein JSU91_05160 [Thermoplasmatales archaeon]|nr:MAG: hypothetical protein JSU91_05160 [Thermoplasmatales archaeon]